MSKMPMALSIRLRWAEELACSAWWGGVSYSIPWWCRGHSQGNQSQTLLSSVTDTPQRTIIIKICLHSFVLNILKHFLTWAGHSERQHSVHPWRFFKSWTGRAMSDLPSNNPPCSSRFHQITCVGPFQPTFLWFYKTWSLKWLPSSLSPWKNSGWMSWRSKASKRVLWSAYRQWDPHTDGH